MNLSSRTLLLANGVTIILFIVSGGSLMQVLWVYWWQSIIIGVIQVIRIIISPIKITRPDGEPVSLISFLFNKAFTLLIFPLHFGFFQYLYFMFLSLLSTRPVFGPPPHTTELVISCLAFALHHVFAFVLEQRTVWKDRTKKPDLQTLMFRPYYRIFPMHFIIMFMFFGGILLGNIIVAVVFMILKTYVDIKSEKDAIKPAPNPPKPGDI